MNRLGRAAFGAALCLGLSLAAQGATAEAAEVTTRHGVSAFDDLALPADFAHAPYAFVDAPKGGRISLRSVSGILTFGSFNPFIFKGDPAAGAADLLFDTLMARNFDEPDALYGLVAESVTLPADRAYAVFNLRSEARFSDGTPVTAEDVVWSFQALKNDGLPAFKVPLQAVASATAVDAATVRYDFEPSAVKRDLPQLVAGLPIFSKAYFADRDFTEATLDPPLTSGPYRVKEFRAGRFVEYARRDDYWARDLPIRRGQFNFDEVRFEYFVDADVALEAFKSGAYDVHEEFRSANWAQKYNFPAIEKGWVIKEALADDRPSGTQGYWINTRREKFADPRVRRALDLAYDFELANRQLFFGIYNRTDSFFENSPLQAAGEPSAAELALLDPLRDQIPQLERDAVFGEAYTPPVTDGTGDNRRNLRRAQKLLIEAGWTPGPDGLVNAAGEPFEIEFLQYANGGFGRITAPFIQNLEALGIKATQRSIDPAAMELRLKEFDFDITVRRYSPGLTPGVALRAFLSSESAAAPASFNLAGVRSPAIDALIEEVQNADSRAALTSAAKALDRVFRAGHYWISNWYKGSYAMAYWDRFGDPRDQGLGRPAYDRGILRTWWYDGEKSDALDVARRE